MSSKKIAIYGYGEIGHVIEEQTNFEIIVIIDNYYSGNSNKAEIVTYEQFVKKYKSKCDAVIIGIASREITEQLIDDLEKDDMDYGILISPQQILKNRLYSDCNILWSTKDTTTIKLQLAIENKLSFMEKNISDLQFGQLFNNTIKGSTWFKEQSISPGGWAVGYNFLYRLYRGLNDIKPQSILELGLGQSTKMISQYAEAFGAKHFVVEHDREWIDYFTSTISYMSKTNIINLPLIKENYKGNEYLAYDGFAEKFGDRKFDFIVIDAPFGGKGKGSRRDVLDILPESLADDFVIILDDYGRLGEQITIDAIKNILNKQEYKYRFAKYLGPYDKDVALIVSESYKWLITV